MGRETLPARRVSHGLPKNKPQAGKLLMRTRAAWGYGATVARLTPDQKVGSSNLSVLRVLYANEKHIACLQRARGVVVSHPLSMREALGSIPSVSICHFHGSLPLAMPPSGHGKCTTRCFACAGSRSVSTSSDVRWGLLCESSLSVVAGTCVMHLSSSLFPGGHDEVGACGARGSG